MSFPRKAKCNRRDPYNENITFLSDTQHYPHCKDTFTFLLQNLRQFAASDVSEFQKL